MKILITGANGYLAKHLIDKFKEHVVIPLTRDNNTSEFILNSNPDVVIHTICSYGRSNESITDIYNSNLFAGIKVLNNIQQLNKKVTFINCGTALEKYTNLYSISKGQFVEFGKFVSNNNLQFINMNLEHFYGRNAPNNFLSFIINQCNVNKDIPLTSGTQKRDFVYIDDVCSAFDSVITYRNKLQNFDTIDVGTGIATPVKDVVLKIKELTRSKSKLLFGEVPLRDNEVGEMKANISKLQSLDWAPQYSIVSGLKEML